MKMKFSAEKLADYVGKIGLVLIAGSLGGSVFGGSVSAVVAITGLLVGAIFVIIGSYKEEEK